MLEVSGLEKASAGLGWKAAAVEALMRQQTKSRVRFFMFSAVMDLQYPVS
jgi:hypothetical protein